MLGVSITGFGGRMYIRRQILIILATCFGFGLLNATLTGDMRAQNPWHHVEQFAVVSLIYWWYHDDKRDRAFLAGRWMNIGMIALAIVTVPIYLFRSRGAKDGAIASVLFVITFFGAVASLVAGAVVGQYVH